VSAGRPLEVIDDRPVQVLVTKARKEPGRGPVPIQRTRIDLEPLKATKRIENAVRQVGARVALAGNARLSGVERPSRKT
jgi:hypothetical protein